MRDSSLSWQKILAQGFSSVSDLLDFLQLPISVGNQLAEKQFPTRVPRGFAERMEKQNPKDPLLLQVLPIDKENELVEGFSHDPLQEWRSNLQKGLIHKYHGRVLLTLTGSCAVNCRFCFRRHFPYQDNNPGRNGWQEVIDYIAADNSIYEVILSGGDPLLASDGVLEELFMELGQIAHVEILRFHSRIPIVLPERINNHFLCLLKQSRMKSVLVLHCNHPQELNEKVAEACQKLGGIGCRLLNQSVLLTGINDDADILARLSRDLFSMGVIPYYLHLLDKVQGAAHFDLPIEQAHVIYQKLQEQLPGYLLPRLVREDAGRKSKTLIF